jgi:hypothetical protein
MLHLKKIKNMENRYTSDYNFQLRVHEALTSKLTEKDAQTLAAQIADDTEAQEEYTFSKNLTMTLKNQELFAVSTLMSQIIAEEGLLEPDESDAQPDFSQDSTSQYEVVNTANLIFKTWIWVGLLSVLLVIGAFSVSKMSLFGKKTETAQLLQRHFSPLENNLFTTSPRGGLTDIEEGMKAYNAKNYQLAAQLLGKSYRFSKDPNVGLYYGVSLLMTNNPVAETEKVLMQVTEELDVPIRHSAEWYLALTLLKAEKWVKLKVSLTIIAPESPYKKAANELLKDLETW